MVVNFAEDAKSAWEEVRDDKSETNWMLVGYGDKKEDIVLSGKGTGGYNEFVDRLKQADGEVLYGGFRCDAVDDESIRPKFVFVSWIGPNVKPLQRARVSTHKPGVTSNLRGYHVEVSASEVDELGQDEIIKKLDSSTGAHRPKEYKF
eukprot:gb/GECH01003540.1/.p1 GENE.gb/GECH01003540.1/~~gb/GECH01003540.1/.p1  ORF type:complete len:148 (+),score=42.30 gb/GECH01003540.1/:1-444(+)